MLTLITQCKNKHVKIKDNNGSKFGKNKMFKLHIITKTELIRTQRFNSFNKLVDL